MEGIALDTRKHMTGIVGKMQEFNTQIHTYSKAFGDRSCHLDILF